MTKLYERFPPELAEKLAAISERILTPEELQCRIDAPFAPGEREDLEAYIAWFQRQYPTPLERLRWASRSYRQWTGNVPESRK